MYLTGIAQRRRLFELATRWLSNRLEPDDGRFVTEVLIYENLISAPVLRSLLADLARHLELGTLCVHRLGTKDDLRRTVIEATKRPSARQAELFRRFEHDPEQFFPGTPADVTVLTGEDGGLCGMIRVKRIRRIADKASRRVAHKLDAELEAEARRVAHGRARAAGRSLGQLEPDPKQMLEDFVAAEERFCQALREGTLEFTPRELRIDDVLGLKLVTPEERFDEIERYLGSHPAVRHVEKEIHSGVYNDVNLLVDVELPPPATIIDHMHGRSWSFATGRGLDERTLADHFPGYVESAARTVRAEVILTTLDELVESEFGRSMHEERILAQRNGGAFSSRISRNATYLIEFLLRFAVSPRVELNALPIRVWGRYLQETFSRAIWELYGLEPSDAVFDSFARDPL